MQTINNINLLDLEEAAAVLKITKPTTRKYVSQGKISGVRIGRKMYISEEALNNFITGRTRLAKNAKA